jgi:hypothetical protein
MVCVHQAIWRSAAARQPCTISFAVSANVSRGIPILVGLWPSEDAVLKDERVRVVIGADYFATSLREALDTCVEVAQQKADAAIRTSGGRAGGTAGS